MAEAHMAATLLTPLFRLLPAAVAEKLRAAALVQAVPADSTARISLIELRRLVDWLAPRTEPGLALVIGAEQDSGSMQALWYYLRSHATLQDALPELVRCFPLLEAGGVQLTAHGGEREFRLRFESDRRPEPQDWWRYDLLMSVLVRALGLLLGRPVRAVSAVLERPPPETPARWRELLADDVQFGGRAHQLGFPAAWLAEPLPGASPSLCAALKPLVEQRLAAVRAEASWAARVYALLAQADRGEEINQAQLADQLHVSESSLRRYLADEGSSFSALLARHRQNQAVSLLLDETLKYDYIAVQLGFAERSSFERAFRSWFGLSPAQFRAQCQSLQLGTRDPTAFRVDQLPPSSRVVQQVIVLLRDEDCSVADLVKLIQPDPVLSARLLGMASSAFFGARKVRTLDDAIGRVLGLNQVRVLALALLASQSLSTRQCPRFDRRRHWTVALIVAQLAADLAPALGEEPGWFYLIGLLHNIGMLVLAHARPEQMADYLVSLQQQPSLADSPVTDRELFGLSRYAAGATLLTHWALPNELIDVVRDLDQETERIDNRAARLMAALAHWARGRVAQSAFTEVELAAALAPLNLPASLIGERCRQTLTNIESLQALASELV